MSSIHNKLCFRVKFYAGLFPLSLCIVYEHNHNLMHVYGIIMWPEQCNYITNMIGGVELCFYCQLVGTGG